MTASAEPVPAVTELLVDTWPPPSGKPRPCPEDPFYLPPVGWEDTAPGTPLRRRHVRIALFGVIPTRLRAWQVLYRSTDLHGRPETTVTTVVVPRHATAQAPVVAHNAPIDAVTSRRFPSYYLQPRTLGLSQTQNEIMLSVAALARGWIVTIPDHEGPQGLWMAARQPGYHILDALRATLASAGNEGIPALRPSNPVAVWGFSGGGTASAWAAEMAPEYAPDLNLVGALIGGPAALPGPLVQFHSGRFASGLIPPVLAAFMMANPAARDYLSAHLTPEGRRIIDKAKRVSLVESVARWPRKDFDKLVDRPLDSIMAAPEISSITDEMRLGQRGPHAPVYLYHAVHDQLLPIAASDRLARDYIAAGTHVTYRRDRSTEHILLAVLGGSDALGWLAARIAGKPLPSHSDVRTVLSTSLTLRAVWSQLRWQWGIAKLLIGRL
ncbi:triacylglycerol lipase [Mycobacteroides saopaulense]|uniref:Triacylglycerol lipase n=1 Tax=Mycobacteroides saopaulense TaxID=1578165 RepID=A0A1X0JC22_9MYCO|nr:triacylglycerol lipase [Mycobacteroides saopaulense]